MAKKAALGMAQKSERRTRLIDQLLDAMKSDELFKTLDYRRKNESYIKQYMHQLLKTRLVEIYKEATPKATADRLKQKAADSLMWEGDVKTTVNHIRFLGAQHRPDFKVIINDLRIAVEVKRGESGAGVREGVGQSLVYAGLPPVSCRLS